MKRIFPAIALIAIGLLATPALAHHRDGYRGWDQGHRHGAACDHGQRDGYRNSRHDYRPFDGYYDRRQAYRSGYRYGNRRYYGHGYRVHHHRHRPVAWVRPAWRHDWRYCEHHGGWFRIGDFVVAYR